MTYFTASNPVLPSGPSSVLRSSSSVASVTSVVTPLHFTLWIFFIFYLEMMPCFTCGHSSAESGQLGKTKYIYTCITYRYVSFHFFKILILRSIFFSSKIFTFVVLRGVCIEYFFFLLRGVCTKFLTFSKSESISLSSHIGHCFEY